MLGRLWGQRGAGEGEAGGSCSSRGGEVWLLPGQGCEQPGKQIDLGDTLEGRLEDLERCHLYGYVLEDYDLWGSSQ